MLPWYLGALILGGVLIGASVLLGGTDADADADTDVDGDVDADLDADVDADADADVDLHADHDHALADDVDAGTWLPFLSLRFWTFALMSFGLTGTLFRLLLDLPVLAEAGLAGAAGLGIGWGAAWAFRRLKQGNVTGQTHLGALPGSEADVLLPLTAGKLGKIRAQVDGHAVDLLARTADSDPLLRKDRVLIVSVDEGVATVTGMRPAADARIQAAASKSPAKTPEKEPPT